MSEKELLEKRKEKIEKIDELFSELDEFGRIEAMKRLSRIRDRGPNDRRTEENPETYYATIPAPDRAPHYGRGFVNIALRVIPWIGEDGEDLYKMVFHLTCIDDGSWDAHGPPESLEKARVRCNKALEILRHHEEMGEWPEFGELKEEFQECGLHLTTH